MIVARGWSEGEEQAYHLADHKLGARELAPALFWSELRVLKFGGV
jgi:hypothetical protein